MGPGSVLLLLRVARGALAPPPTEPRDSANSTDEWNGFSAERQIFEREKI